MKKLGLLIDLLICVVVWSALPNTAFAQPVAASVPSRVDVPYAVQKVEAAKVLVEKLLPRSGRKNVKTGTVRDFEGVYIVSIIDAKNPKIIRNELVVRKDAAVLPVFGAHLAGRRVSTQIDTADKAKGHARIWLWYTKQDGLIAADVARSEFTFIVTIAKKNEPKKKVNQLLIRKDGYILPVGDGHSMVPLLAPKTRVAGGGFGWCIGCDGLPNMESMIGNYDDPWGSWGNPGSGSDWDTGWFGSDWGWGWGSGGSWEPPDGGDSMNDQQRWCLIRCHDFCRGTDPTQNCFEECIDRCLGERDLDN